MGCWGASHCKNNPLSSRKPPENRQVYARTGKTSRDVSLFLVEKGTKGFSLGQKIEDKCGMRASMTAELVFQDCRVPASNLIGEEGKATLCMMRNLEIERVVLAAMSLGIARRCIEEMNRYARERQAFGSNLNSFGQIQRFIAESYAEYQAVARVARYLKLAMRGAARMIIDFASELKVAPTHGIQQRVARLQVRRHPHVFVSDKCQEAEHFKGSGSLW
ncbi:unnamed protein product [Cladocopium goreaui]|uniref:Isovaleryl-CoA dehydrogenase, mitochondrial (IVD) n=1 Tax=Cladocopium goreaui TaxID=2562237 RepID=A0A9P1BG68_9DINO|nr:unnamed protein product [Cladocopium goreaui]